MRRFLVAIVVSLMQVLNVLSVGDSASAGTTNGTAFSYTFDTCGQSSGRSGPSKAQCLDSYSQNTDVASIGFDVQNGLQSFIAPATTDYTFEVAGAIGGGLGNDSHAAIIKMTLPARKGQTFTMLVGQEGTTLGVDPTFPEVQRGGSGGGATLLLLDNEPVAVAAGSGGGGTDNAVQRDATQYTTDVTPPASPSAGRSQWSGGTGAGYFTGGQSYNHANCVGHSANGLSFGGQGGLGSANLGADGGFGGGGEVCLGNASASGGGWQGGQVADSPYFVIQRSGKTYIDIQRGGAGLSFISPTASNASISPTGVAAGFVKVSFIKPPELLTLTPAPTLDSGLQVGRTVHVVIGDWDAGVTTTVQWYRDDVAIGGAAGTSYTVVADDLLHNIIAKVTGAKDGSPSVTVSTAPQQPIVGSMTLTPNPKILGTVQVFKTVTVDIGTWDDGVTTTVQWLRNGQWISGATSTSYTVSPLDTGVPLTVRVSAFKTGYSPESKTSDGMYPELAHYVDRPSPTISGVFKTGQILTAQNGTWPEGSMYLYQWLREGYEITGATESTFALTKADLTFHITVRVNTVTPGYSPTFVTSAGQLVTPGLMNVNPKPGISGSVKVGKTASANAIAWAAGAKIAYQWLLDGKPIKGATKASYHLLTAQKGHMLSLKVTQTTTGYLQTTFTTTATKVS